MPSTIERLTTKQLISPPPWMAGNVMFETIIGSVAFGVSDNVSDMDTLGFCIPPKDIVFPHLGGEIVGFGRQKKRFTCYQKHHVYDANALGSVGRMYDLNIYNIVHYFHLCMENNPNMIASLFTPWDCVLHSTKVSNMIHNKRHRFLHRGAWHRFKGYAYNQLAKMRTKTPDSKRYAEIKKHGYDVKFAYHVVRLLDEVEQILTLGDLDIRRNRAQLKAICRGEVPEEDIYKWASEKEKYLERAYEKSTIPSGPNEDYIRNLLLECLEEHWGSLERYVALDKLPVVALREIAEVIDKNRNLLGV